MRATSILTGIALFGAGLTCGWLLADWTPANQQAEVALKPTPVEPSISAPETKEFANTVWLTVEFDGGSSLVPAARLRNTGLLLASLYSIYPANSVHYLNVDGEQVFPQVVAANHLTNLIAFKDNHQSGYLLSQEDGSLFVGKPVTLGLPDGALQGQVESSLQTAPDGRNYFNVDFTRAESQRGGPLLAPNTTELIGFVTTSRHVNPGWMHLSGEVYSAIDATSVRSFLRADSFSNAQSVRNFTARFAQTSGGLRYSIAQFAQRQQWEPAYRALEVLMAIDGNNTGVTQRALTLAAYYYGHQLVEAGNANLAITLAEDLRGLYPQHQPWCLVESRAYGQLKKWASAFERAKECLQDPYGSKPRDNELLGSPFRASLTRTDSRDAVIDLAHSTAIQFAQNTNASRQLRMNVLLEALDMAEHPQIYRLLGDLEYDAKNYTVAQNYYRSAIRLDPSIAASLGNRLRNSSQRANSAPASEIPFENRGGGLVVTARINDSPQVFRLLLDTGATYSALSGGTLLRLGLGNIFNNVSEVVELEAAGGTIYARRFTLDSMQIGDARVTQIPVVILENLEGFDGLVGLSFLRHFDVSIDQEAGKLILVQH